MRPVRFRIVFWLLVLLGALPQAVSGVALVGWFRVDHLCAPSPSIIAFDTFKHLVTWQRIHDWGRWGALLAGLMILSYTAAWAYEAKLARGPRRVLMVVLLGVLLPSLALALWTGRAVPWTGLAPGVTLGGPKAITMLPGRSPEQSGGPAWCAEHAAQVSHLRWAWMAHVIAGALAILVILALADFAARWRQAKTTAQQS
jgi:hypothetical protein